MHRNLQTSVSQKSWLDQSFVSEFGRIPPLLCRSLRCGDSHDLICCVNCAVRLHKTKHDAKTPTEACSVDQYSMLRFEGTLHDIDIYWTLLNCTRVHLYLCMHKTVRARHR